MVGVKTTRKVQCESSAGLGGLGEFWFHYLAVGMRGLDVYRSPEGWEAGPALIFPGMLRELLVGQKD